MRETKPKLREHSVPQLPGRCEGDKVQKIERRKALADLIEGWTEITTPHQSQYPEGQDEKPKQRFRAGIEGVTLHTVVVDEGYNQEDK